MGVRLSSAENVCCLFDSVTGIAFGPAFDTEEQASLFLQWYQAAYGDPRKDVFLVQGRKLFMQRQNTWHNATHDAWDGTFRVEVAKNLVKDELGKVEG